MFDIFIQAVKGIYPISANIQRDLEQRLVKTNHEVGEIIIPIGKVNDKLFFIEQGMVRCFYHKIEKGKKIEMTSWLINDFNFVYVPHSFIAQSPSLEAVEVLEPTTLISISYNSLQELYQKYHEAAYIGRLITEMYLVMYDKRVRSLRMMSAKDRHDSFKENFPAIYERASKKHIASFLGLTPETLSRIRNQD
jgi:CRP/FNR family transcriptional regulator, anaerobic regulatory protein